MDGGIVLLNFANENFPTKNECSLLWYGCTSSKEMTIKRLRFFDDWSSCFQIAPSTPSSWYWRRARTPSSAVVSF